MQLRWRAAVVEQPLARGVGVFQRLQRRERLGGNDKQGATGVGVVQGITDVGAVDIGDKAQLHVRLAIGDQGIGHHPWAEVAAADADVDDAFDGLVAETAPMAAVQLFDQLSHLLKGGSYLLLLGCLRLALKAQAGVQGWALLGVVDRLAGEQLGNGLRQPAGLGVIGEQGQGLFAEVIFRVIQQQSGRFDTAALAAIGVQRKQFLQRLVLTLALLFDQAMLGYLAIHGGLTGSMIVLAQA